MKISKLFHWLYAILMFLPIVNVFAYTLRYGFNYGNQIPSVSENVQRSVEFNQHFAYNDFTKEFSYNDDNSRTYNYGGYMWQNHIYIVSFEVDDLVNPNNNRFAINVGADSSFYVGTLSQDGYVQYRGLCPSTGNINYMYLVNDLNVTLDCTFTFSHYNIIDLTQMFGAGQEPSLEQFRAWFPDSYYDYTPGEYVVIPDYSSVSVSDDVTNHFWLPQFGQVGHTINNVIGFLLSNVFGLVVTVGIGYIVCGLFTYWLIISLAWLIFDVLMYVPLLVHRWLDKASIN